MVPYRGHNRCFGVSRRPAHGRTSREIPLSPDCRVERLLRLMRCCYNPRRLELATGTVKWFNPAKGFGFIQPSGGGQDVFVHVTALERAGLTTLNEGQKVNYELANERGRTKAINIEVAA